MTYVEALKFLDEHCTASVIPFEVKVLCSNALEKQIPKKLIFTSMNYGTATCMNCHKPISLNGYEVTEEWLKENQYCRHCGQRIGSDSQ